MTRKKEYKGGASVQDLRRAFDEGMAAWPNKKCRYILHRPMWTEWHRGWMAAQASHDYETANPPLEGDDAEHEKLNNHQANDRLQSPSMNDVPCVDSDPPYQLIESRKSVQTAVCRRSCLNRAATTQK